MPESLGSRLSWLGHSPFGILDNQQGKRWSKFWGAHKLGFLAFSVKQGTIKQRHSCMGLVCFIFFSGTCSDEAEPRDRGARASVGLKCNCGSANVLLVSRTCQALEAMAVGQNQWYHFGVGAPPILEPILVVGLGCSLGVRFGF